MHDDLDQERVAGHWTITVPEKTPTNEPRRCRADYDGNGRLEVFDLLVFFNLYEVRDIRADFDRDGEVTIFDARDIINAVSDGRCS